MENKHKNYDEVASWVDKYLSQPMNKQPQEMVDFLNEAVPKVMMYLDNKVDQIKEEDIISYKEDLLNMLEMDEEELDRFLSGDLNEDDLELTPKRLKQAGILIAFLIVAWNLGKNVFNLAFIGAALFLTHTYLERKQDD